MSILKGAEIIIQSLLKENVDVVFGYPGGAVLDLYDELLKAPIKHYLTRHEQGAVHAADGYARSTGKVGVCFATSGPGCTNLVTGLANAYRDSVPLVAITGQVGSSLIGRDAFQESDIRSISMSITKHNYLITDVKRLAQSIREAFHIAQTGRPGPVLIDVPDDIAQAKTEYIYPKRIKLPGYKPTINAHPVQISKAAAEINNSKQPLIFVGGGAVSSDAALEVRELITKAHLPVITSLMASGIYPNRNQELSLGMPGLFGTKCANLASAEADLLIAVGARFDNRVTCSLDKYCSKAKIIHIDIDPAEIGKNVAADIPIVGDIKHVLRKLNPQVKYVEREKWLNRIKELKQDDGLKYEDCPEKMIKPQYVLEELSALLPAKAIIATDVGQHQMWAANYINYINPRSFLTSGGLGTMGFGYPAALGAKVAHPDQEVVLISGDGSFQMNMQELATSITYNLPVKIVLFNNCCLGMVKQYQEFFYGNRLSQVELKGPDFIQLAKAYNIAGVRIDKKEQVASALKEMFDHQGSFLLEVTISPKENVCPMVAPGAGVTEMIGG